MDTKNSITINNYIKIDQGISDAYSFIMGKLPSTEIYNFSNIIRLSEDPTGVQRFLDMERVKKIAKYCETKNAIFPTPIILSLNSDFIKDDPKNDPNSLVINTDNEFIEELGKPFSIIDGQHRIEGIKWYHNHVSSNDKKDFSLPVIIYLNADQATAASIFVTINANQRSVDKSIIHQLFGIIYDESDKYTVQSFSNEVTKILNKNPYSPFYESIKMLGKKMDAKEFISQGTITKKLTERISSNIEVDNLSIENGKTLKNIPNKIFRIYFMNNKPTTVAKIMLNFFNAFSKSFPNIWKDENFITKKAVGFSALMKLLDHIYTTTDDLQEEQLMVTFEKLNEIRGQDIEKLFEISASSESVATYISKKIISYYDEVKKTK